MVPGQKSSCGCIEQSLIDKRIDEWIANFFAFALNNGFGYYDYTSAKYITNVVTSLQRVWYKLLIIFVIYSIFFGICITSIGGTVCLETDLGLTVIRVLLVQIRLEENNCSLNKPNKLTLVVVTIT